MDLENCPFCDAGGPSLLQADDHHPAHGKWTVVCWAPGCGATCGWHETPVVAEAAWNRREELERELAA